MYTSKAVLMAALAAFCLARAGHDRTNNGATVRNHQQRQVTATSADFRLERRAELSAKSDTDELFSLFESFQSNMLLRNLPLEEPMKSSLHQGTHSGD